MDSKEHLSFDQIYDYVNISDINDENSDLLMEVEEHIAGCVDCLKKVKAADGMMGLFEKWTAKTHGMLDQRLTVCKSLYRLAGKESSNQLKDRVMDWLTRYSGKVDSMLTLMMNLKEDIKGEVTKIIPQGNQSMLTAHPRWNFEYAVEVSRGSGPAVKRKTKVIDSGKNGTEVTINAIDKQVIVKLCGISSADQVPLVALIPNSTAYEPLLSLPVFNVPYGCWITRFDNIQSGEYLLIFEPWHMQ